MVETAQHPFGRRERPHIVGQRDRQDGEQRNDIEDRSRIFARTGMENGERQQGRAGRYRKNDPDRVHDAVRDQFRAGIVKTPVEGQV
mgnify:CR=1 FL=1